MELARLAGSCSVAAWSPDGEHLAFLGIDEEGEPFGCEDSLWACRPPAERRAISRRAVISTSR